MGVDTEIILPYSAQARHIAQVAGMLAGLPRTDSYDVVPGAKLITPSPDSPEILNIQLNGEMVDGVKLRQCLLFMETTTGQGKLLMPRSTPFWVAIGIKLVDFFGGSIRYQDYSAPEHADYFRPTRDNTTEGRDDESNYYAMQERLKNVVPLTLDDLKAVEDKAAYPLELAFFNNY